MSKTSPKSAVQAVDPEDIEYAQGFAIGVKIASGIELDPEDLEELPDICRDELRNATSGEAE